jgi:acetyl-CoA acetyltransferase
VYLPSPPTGRFALQEDGTGGDHQGALRYVSVKNHKNGCYNPRAQYQKDCSIEDVVNARTIASPMTTLSCSPIGDGSAAVILCAKDKAAKYTTKIYPSPASYFDRRI